MTITLALDNIRLDEGTQVAAEARPRFLDQVDRAATVLRDLQRALEVS